MCEGLPPRAQPEAGLVRLKRRAVAMPSPSTFVNYSKRTHPNTTTSREFQRILARAARKQLAMSYPVAMPPVLTPFLSVIAAIASLTPAWRAARGGPGESVESGLAKRVIRVAKSP